MPGTHELALLAPKFQAPSDLTISAQPVALHGRQELEFQAPDDSPMDYIERISGLVPGTERAALSFADQGWLAGLCGITLDADLLSSANEHMAVGSLNMGHSKRVDPKDVLRARTLFYEQDLGLLDRDPGGYETFVKKFKNFVPVDTFVGTLRVLDAAGVKTASRLAKINYGPERARLVINHLVSAALDPRVLLNGCIGALGSSTDVIDEAIEQIENEGFPRTILNNFGQFIGYSAESRAKALQRMHDVHGSRAAAVVAMFPSRLGNRPEREEARVGHVQTMINAIGLKYSAWDLVNAQPTIASSSTAKLFAQGHLFHGFLDPEASLRGIARMMTVPLEDQILAIYSGALLLHEEQIAKAIAHISQAERTERVTEILRDPEFVARLGVSAAQSYIRWAAGRPEASLVAESSLSRVAKK